MRERERDDRMRVCERVCVCAAKKKQKMKERGRVTGEERVLEEKMSGGVLWGRWDT